MKKVTLILCIILIALSCKKENVSPKVEPAKLSLNVGVKIVEMEMYKVKKSTAGVEDYRVEIRNTENEIVLEYDRASDMPETIEIEPGTYTVIAQSNNLTPAAFSNPYYYGEIEITLAEGEESTETVTCSLANCAVRIVYSQNIIDGFDSYSTVVSNTDGGSLTYDEDETRLGYFSLSPITITATLTNSSETKTLNGSIANPEAQKLYEIQLDATATESGSELTINLVEDGTTSTEIVTINEGPTSGREPAVGELIISEIMANPAALADADGEYIEIYNTASDDINLNGLIIRDNTNDYTINDDVFIEGNGYVSVATSDLVTFTPDYIISNLGLLNGGETLGLYYDINTVETEISSLNFEDSSFPNVQSGASLELSINHLNTTDAANGAFWCTAVSEISAGNDLGTPGMANDCNTN